MAIGPKSFDFRESTRTPVRTEVHLQFDRDEDVVGYSANLSPGGIFITVRDPKPIGTLLRFSIDLPDDDSVRGYGEVTWIRVKYHGPDRPSGMGIRFRHLEDDGKERVEQYILSMTHSEPEPETGEDTVAAVPEASPAIATAFREGGIEQEVIVSSTKEADLDETLAALTEEPMAEVWLAEEGDEGLASQGPAGHGDGEELAALDSAVLSSAETVTPTTSELLLPPTEAEQPPPEPLADEADTAVYPELAVAETIEVPIATASDDRQVGAEVTQEEAVLGSEESTDDLSIDTAVIDEDELLSLDSVLPAPESLEPAGQRVGTDELSAAFGDLYPADRQGEREEADESDEHGESDSQVELSLAETRSPMASGQAALPLDLDVGDRSKGAADGEELLRPAQWLTLPVPDPELEETLDGLLRETERPVAALKDQSLPSRPRFGVVEPARERSGSPVWTELPRESEQPASGRPPGSSRTSIAGAARAEEKWKKTFFGMPSRTFLWLLAGLVVVAFVGYFFAVRIVGWIGDRGAGTRTVDTVGAGTTGAASGVADGVVAETGSSPARPNDPTQGAPTTTPDALDSANAEAVVESSEQPLAGTAGATTEVANRHFPAALRATVDGGLDLTRLQLEEGAAVRRLLASHDRALSPRSMRQVTDLVWRQRGAETIVTITGDGALEAGRYSQEQMPGARPRVLIRVRGIRGEFPQPISQVGTPQLAVIRLGYTGADQRELQVVLDLSNEGVRVRSIDLTGAGLEIHLSAQ